MKTRHRTRKLRSQLSLLRYRVNRELLRIANILGSIPPINFRQTGKTLLLESILAGHIETGIRLTKASLKYMTPEMKCGLLKMLKAVKVYEKKSV